ncbi:class I SAM-dependent methyltransferase [Algibacter pacificus]|uniref:class I SAM-dependent methyltransferase n=1 Tax=Algibacter pacificus TaxID=2599389 RepID=UPI001FE46C9D|nr:class I SAM-dependent methyltransferase [Algibacter pacificus]
MTKRNKKPWPTKDAMSQIYELNLWGGKAFDFYSGAGSHEAEIVNPYLEVIQFFLKKHNSTLTVCDLGCGDFNVGSKLIKYTKKYWAIDIVEKLIERNKKWYQADNLEFQCLDIAKDDLPMADCVILRQVLQHLSNAEIQAVVKKLTHYKYIILTEHVPLGGFIPNKDIISGQGIRLKQGSGVDLLKAPFNLLIKEQIVLGEFVLKDGKGRIVTLLYEVF